MFGTSNDANIKRIINTEEILSSQKSEESIPWDSEDEEIAAIMDDLARDNAVNSSTNNQQDLQETNKLSQIEKKRRRESPEIEILNDCPPSFGKRKRKKRKLSNS